MREADYQAELIKKIEKLLPGCIVLKNDSGYRQGVLDLSVFYGPRWAWLEVKASATAPYQPNQEYYVALAWEMSYAAVIHPQNKEYILYELQITLSPRG